MKHREASLRWWLLGMCVAMLWPQARAFALPENSARCLTRAASMRGSSWLPPLDRILTLSTSEMSSRDALDRVAQAAHIQLSFSAELIPAERRVCLAFDRIPVGAALEAIIDELPLKVMVVGATQVVLAPARPVARVDSSEFARNSSVLDRVVVTGSPEGAPQRASAFALEVIEGTRLASYGVTGLGQALELAVPGMWMWSTSPGAMTAQYASIRGASSFGTSAPKIYLDGVEVANPLLVTQIDVARIDHIEVIRGPQGAALYGADAISGVISIITRTDGTPNGAPLVQLSTSAGLSETDFASRAPFVQQHAVTVRAGEGPLTGGAGFNISNVGAYVPGASEFRMLLDGNGRAVHAKGIFSGTARLALQRANPAVTPFPSSSGDTIGRQSLAQYTLGVTATTMPSPIWTVTGVAGVDGFRVRGLSNASLPVPLSLQDDVQNARGGADRFSFRLRGTARMDVAPRTMMTLTFAAEQAMLGDASDGAIAQPANGGPQGEGHGPQVLESSWATNSGFVAQGDLAWRDMLYLVVGGRVERTVGATPLPQTASMPMLGATFARDVAGATVKARIGYGRGIRPAQTLMRGASWAGRAELDARATLSPESQSGVEFGTDIVFGNRLSLHATRFDQHATDLIQPVAYEVIGNNPRSGPPMADSIRPRRIAYVLENVGAIDNTGWELEANARWRSLSLIGWWSSVDSRVARVATAYRGDLRTGDRPLEVPSQTMSISANWTAGRMQLGTTVARAADWIGYDRVKIASELAANPDATAEMTGSQLRRYWRQYSGVTRVRATMGLRISRQTSLQIGGENLLDLQRGSPDNATITTGRTITIGAKATF